MLQASIRRGELDRQITFIEEVVSRGTSNQDKVTSWALIGTNPTVFSRKKDQRGGEVVVADQLQYVQKTVFTIVYRSDLSVKYRVVFGGKVYEIVSITESGEQRNSYLDVVANILDNEIWT